MPRPEISPPFGTPAVLADLGVDICAEITAPALQRDVTAELLHANSVDSPPVALTPLGLAVLTDVVGAGATATVYRARVSGVPMAIKVLHPEYTVDEDAMARFVQEISVVADLNHPAVPTFYASGFTSDERPFAAFAFIEGETLRAWVSKHGALALPEALRILDDLLEILILAHQKGIVHRDIKPANIILDPSGLVYLLDFGLAKLHERAELAPQSVSGVPLGTPSYMSPEQASGVAVVGPTSDLFALGLTVLFALAGRNLRRATNAVELIAEAAEPFMPVRSFGLGLPPTVEALFDRALQYDAAERFPSAEAMQRAVRVAGRAIGVILPVRNGSRDSGEATAITARDSDAEGYTDDPPQPGERTLAPAAVLRGALPAPVAFRRPDLAHAALLAGPPASGSPKAAVAQRPHALALLDAFVAHVVLIYRTILRFLCG